MTNIRKEREDITTDAMGINNIIKEVKNTMKVYYEQLFAHRFVIT